MFDFNFSPWYGPKVAPFVKGFVAKTPKPAFSMRLALISIPSGRVAMALFKNADGSTIESGIGLMMGCNEHSPWKNSWHLSQTKEIMYCSVNFIGMIDTLK